MDHEDGKIIGENAVDIIGVAEEHYPSCVLLAVQTTLVVEYEGKIQIVNVVKEID